MVVSGLAVAQRLAEQGIVLPPVTPPLANYVPAVSAGQFVWTSGQIPLREGKLVAAGLVGSDVDVPAAVQAARVCAINVVAAIAEQVDLDRVSQVVKVQVFVASAPDFRGQSAVADGASDLLVAVFGDIGRHARSAVGVTGLPRDACVEVDCVVALA